MSPADKVIRWRCHICGRTFRELGGGICAKCGTPACSVCLSISRLKSLAKVRTPEARVCKACAQK